MVTDPIDKFNPDVESITDYLEQMDVYFNVNKMEDNIKVLVFLNAIGEKKYTLLRNNLAPEKLKDQMLKKLSDIFSRHFKLIKVIMAENFHFYRWNQSSDE